MRIVVRIPLELEFLYKKKKKEESSTSDWWSAAYLKGLTFPRNLRKRGTLGGP
jgi:hypothetical protein